MKTGIVALALAAAMVCQAAPARANILNVQVRTGKLREQPSFLGRIVGEVAYGDQIQVVREQGEWVLGRSNSSLEGWIHISALTDDEIVLAAGKGNVETAASGDELALAGKGFNSQVEAEFRAQNREIDFAWVDRMEKFIVTPEEMIGFLKVGDVVPPAGGGR